MIFGFNNEEITKIIDFYQKWKDVVDQPEFLDLKAKVEIREIDEQLEQLSKRRQKLNEQINRNIS